MITSFEAGLLDLAAHHVGNPLHDAGYALSDQPINLGDEVMKRMLKYYFLTPFEKTNEVYNLYHPGGDLFMNEVYALALDVFLDHKCFHGVSQELAKHLYSVSNHPKIKSGEMYVCLFENIQIEGELLTALGIFKSETKESYLKASSAIGRIDLSYEEQGININNLDKGCLIFNTKAEDGFKVVVIDNGSKSGPGYWKDEFLNVKIRPDNYTRTGDLLNLCKSFIKHKLDDEFEMSQSDKAELLNRTVKYFQEKDEFDMDEFTGEVIANEQAASSFKQYKETHAEDFELDLPDTFIISDAAVKKGMRALKNVIKLDRNFRIEITGNKELIERGYDDDRAMNYYKVYFKEETA